MATISLESAIRTCKVDTAYANKVQSDRFLSPNLMVCPVWNGVDTTGREVCPDSYFTKNAGCNSAEDRVFVENSVSRPQYMEYINLNAGGIDGNIYGNTMPYAQVGQTSRELNAINNVTGNFGLQFGANTYPGCNYYPYEQAVNQERDFASNTVTVPPTDYGHLSKDYNPMGYPPTTSKPMMNSQQPMMNSGMMNSGMKNSGYVDMPQQPMIVPSGVMPVNAHANVVIEGFQNLPGNPVNNYSSQVFANNQQQLRQQQFLNQGFVGNDFRRSGGN